MISLPYSFFGEIARPAACPWLLHAGLTKIFSLFLSSGLSGICSFFALLKQCPDRLIPGIIIFQFG